VTDPFRLLGRTRRHFFRDCGVGLGSIALSSLLAADKPAPSADPLAPKTPHHRSKAKSIIYLFMAGGPSQLEFFDHKPKLNELNGQPIPASFIEGKRFRSWARATASTCAAMTSISSSTARAAHG